MVVFLVVLAGIACVVALFFALDWWWAGIQKHRIYRDPGKRPANFDHTDEAWRLAWYDQTKRSDKRLRGS